MVESLKPRPMFGLIAARRIIKLSNKDDMLKAEYWGKLYGRVSFIRKLKGRRVGDVYRDGAGTKFAQYRTSSSHAKIFMPHLVKASVVMNIRFSCKNIGTYIYGSFRTTISAEDHAGARRLIMASNDQVIYLIQPRGVTPQ